MMKILIRILIVSILSLNLSGARAEGKPASAPWALHGKLQVSYDGHYLVHKDGTPFFWLGDTGWEMLHRLSREEIETYLENRRSKGFNVIHTVIISEFIHTDKETNFYGDSVLINYEPERNQLQENFRIQERKYLMYQACRRNLHGCAAEGVATGY